MAFILIIVVTLGRLFYTYIGVVNAARAGAQYGSNSVITAADFSGMKAAAKQDGAKIASLTVTASQCTCGTANPPALSACSSNYCTNDPQGNYVVVNAQAPFSIVLRFPGLPSSVTVTLTGQAVMQVQEQ
jgi:hypothetical protein